jgi:hypothetical protein
MRPKNRVIARPTKLSTAVRPVLETLEERRLMSGTLTLVNPDALPSSNRLIFNTIPTSGLNATYPNATHTTSPLELENTGTGPLTIEALTTSGPFTVVNPPSDGTVIAAGSSVTITVDFTQSSLPAHSVNETNYTNNPNGGAEIDGSLSVSTSDAVNPVQTVALAGYWQSQSENNAEPNLTTITNLLAGYQTVISNPYAVDLTEADDTRELYGSEVYSASWQAADPTQGVGIDELAEFHTEGNVVHTYWYNSTTQSSQLLFTSLADEGQTLLPHTEGGALAQSLFYPGTSSFGLRVDNEYSDDAINLANGNDGGGGHHFRFYPLVDANGNTVPNTYLVAMDYAVLQTENFDFQDNVFIVSNIRPSEAPPAPANLTATGGATPVLNWSAVSYTPLAGYNVYRSTTATGDFTKLTATPITATTYTDTTAPGGLKLYYEVTSVDSSTLQESSPATVDANTPGGPDAVNDTATAYTSQPTVIPVLSNDTDTTGSIVPSSVTIISGPNSGGTVSVDSGTGSITYTSAANFSGVETFTYEETDSNGSVSAPATVTVTVTNPVTSTPTANADTAFTLEGTLVNIPVLANDIAVTTLNTSSVAVGTAAHGTVSVNTANGTVNYTPASGYVGSDSFTYTVDDGNGQVSNAATVTVYTGVSISSAKGASHTLTYTDTTGSPATITLNRGVADVYFSGDGSALTVVKGSSIQVSGTHMFAEQVTLTGTTAASTFKMTSRSTGNLTLTGFTDTGTLGTFNAPNTNLDGNMTFGGLGSLILKSSVITPNGAAVITVGSGTRSVSLKVGAFSDTSFNSAVGIKSIAANSWTNISNDTISVTAPSLSSLVVKGAFAPSLQLSGPLGSAVVTGSLGTGFWEVGGTTKSVNVGSAGNAWGATFGGTLSSLVVKSGGLADDVTAANVGSISVVGNVTGDITAASVKSLKITGSVTGSTLDFTNGISRTPALGSLVVTGAVTSTDIITTGNASLVEAGSFASSIVDIGGTTDATTVDTATVSDLGSATLGTIKTTGKSGTVFSDTSVLAHQVNAVSLGQVNATTTNPEGVAAIVIKSASLVINTGKVSLGTKQLVSQAELNSYLGGKNYTLGTFQLDIVTDAN